MKTDSGKGDTFREMIRGILLSGAPGSGKDSCKSRIFAEVQNYSTEVQEIENASDLFFRLCELIVDCQSLSIPDDSFRVMVAYLLYETDGMTSVADEEVRKLLGMDLAGFEAARENVKNRQCIVSSLNREKTGRKGAMMAGKGNMGVNVNI